MAGIRLRGGDPDPMRSKSAARRYGRLDVLVQVEDVVGIPGALEGGQPRELVRTIRPTDAGLSLRRPACSRRRRSRMTPSRCHRRGRPRGVPRPRRGPATPWRRSTPAALRGRCRPSPRPRHPRPRRHAAPGRRPARALQSVSVAARSDATCQVRLDGRVGQLREVVALGIAPRAVALVVVEQGLELDVSKLPDLLLQGRADAPEAPTGMRWPRPGRPPRCIRG